ncbi:hypothetical protein [Aquimarina sp. AU474]|uniref:hypothetical protein n=1 Tax=Aquimarina sp. AU474 TaxID=2108529 RepID=UPI000D68DF4E|nr:hypothetical protein [Aquimarina sp. AU474]
MVKYYDLSFTKVEVYNSYLINTISEGFIVMPKHNAILLDFVKEHFSNKNFIYISNRVNSYSVNPTVYYETKKIQKLIGIAVVSKNPRQKLLCEMEGSFYKNNLECFKTMPEALLWKDAMLTKHEKRKTS